MLLLVKGSSETGLFRHLSNHVFGSAEFGKKVGYEGHFVFENVQNLMYILKIQRLFQR